VAGAILQFIAHKELNAKAPAKFSLMSRSKAVLTSILIGMLALVAPVSFAASATPAHAVPSVVQFGEGYSAGGSATMVDLTFSQSVTAGDVIVVCAGIVSGNVVNIKARALFDSLGTTFTPLTHASSQEGRDNSFAKVWYGVVQSSGTDTITLNYISGPAALFGYEVSGSGTSPGSYMTSHKQDSGNPTSGSFVHPFTPATNSLVIACGGFFTPEGAGTVSAGTGYTLDGSFSGNNGAEHLSGSSGTTTAPFGFSQVVYYWSEVAVSLAPS
jgi:hypothetical protein